MDQAHIHLLITHLPIFGSILGALVLGFAIFKKNSTTAAAAHYVLILSALGAVVAYITGEGAEETVEEIKGVSENIIGQHAYFAAYALAALIAVGVASLITLYVEYIKNPLSKTFSTITLFLALISFSLVARTGYLGGQIRHTEIGTASLQNGGEHGGEQGDNDD